MPVNILLLPGIYNFEILKKIGVARILLASGFFKTSINAMKDISEKLLHGEKMNEVAGNSVNTPYLNNLISKK